MMKKKMTTSKFKMRLFTLLPKLARLLLRLKLKKKATQPSSSCLVWSALWDCKSSLSLHTISTLASKRMKNRQMLLLFPPSKSNNKMTVTTAPSKVWLQTLQALLLLKKELKRWEPEDFGTTFLVRTTKTKLIRKFEFELIWTFLFENVFNSIN